MVTGAGGNTVGNVTTFEITAPVLTPAFVNLLLNTGINAVLTTAASPNGEVRGQVLRLVREGYTISLNGAQENPNAVVSAGYGVGVVSIDRDQDNVHFMSVWGGQWWRSCPGSIRSHVPNDAGGPRKLF